MTIQESVIAKIRESITSGDLPAGSQLIQEDLAHQWGVSRVPVREALQTLTAEGLVEHHPNRGFFVARLSVDDLAEVYRLRALIEHDVMIEAAANASKSQLREVERLLVAVERAKSPARVAAANRRFHFAVFELANLPRSVRLLEQLWDATEAHRAVYFALPNSVERITEEHRVQWRALAAGEGLQAAEAQALHRRHAEQEVSRFLLDREDADCIQSGDDRREKP